MKRLAELMLITFSCFSAVAADTVALPRDSQLQVSEIGQESGGIIRFSGAIAFEGQFVLERPLIDGEASEVSARIIVSKETSSFFPVVEGASPEQLNVLNPEILLETLASESTRKALNDAELLEFVGRGAFRVSGLYTAVDCNHRAWVVQVDSASPAGGLTSDPVPPAPGC